MSYLLDGKIRLLTRVYSTKHDDMKAVNTIKYSQAYPCPDRNCSLAGVPCKDDVHVVHLLLYRGNSSDCNGGENCYYSCYHHRGTDAMNLCSHYSHHGLNTMN